MRVGSVVAGAVRTLNGQELATGEGSGSAWRPNADLILRQREFAVKRWTRELRLGLPEDRVRKSRNPAGRRNPRRWQPTGAKNSWHWASPTLNDWIAR